LHENELNIFKDILEDHKSQITKNMLVTISLKMESENGSFLDDSEQLTYLHGGYGQITLPQTVKTTNLKSLFHL